jgi:hypothetical protein
MKAPLRILLSGLIDYAGTFPPASLSLAAAAANWRSYVGAEHRWILGRFAVPASRLLELPQDLPGHIAAISGEDLTATIQLAHAYNMRAGRPAVDTVEAKWTGSAHTVPPGFTAYFEVPVTSSLEQDIASIAVAGARAKIRTASVSSPDLVRFLGVCRAAGVAFKATAGLHHPLHSGSSHGFLNVFLAAAFAGCEQVLNILQEESAEAFHWDSDGVEWRGHRLSREDLRTSRETFAISFGSCSFEEPLAGLRDLDLL